MIDGSVNSESVLPKSVITRKDLPDKLQLEMTDQELEKKLKALVKAGIIKQRNTDYDS